MLCLLLVTSTAIHEQNMKGLGCPSNKAPVNALLQRVERSADAALGFSGIRI